MIPLKAIFVISVLISGLIFAPSYSFAQSNQEDSPLSSLFEIFRQLFSFGNEPSEPITEFGKSVILQTGGSSSTSDTTENNILPTANAGPDQTVLEFATVTLDGSSSTDIDGTIVSYNWTQISDPPVELSSTSEKNPTFIAPKVESDDLILRFSLEVKDNSGDTATDEVDVTVKNVNAPPTANAGPDQTVLEFATVTLDGSSSTDIDGTIVSYSWTQISDPPVELSSTLEKNPTFVVPDVDSNQILIFSLNVTDNSGASDVDDVEITVNEVDYGTNDDGTNDDGTNDNNVNVNNNENRKVTICHIPPGNPNNSHTIRIGESAVSAHLAHGDREGPCNGNNDQNDNNENKHENSRENNSKIDNSDNGKQNKKDEKEKKSNSGKEKNDQNDNNENKQSNSGKGNSGIDNSDKENQNKKDKKSNSGKEKNDQNDNNKNKQSNSGKNNSEVNNSDKGKPDDKKAKKEKQSKSDKETRDEDDD